VAKTKRQLQSTPVAEALATWADNTVRQLSRKSELAQAFRYMRAPGGYFVLRLADVERLSKDPRARASETAFPEMHSVIDGALFDGIRCGMLTANGDAHRRRRSPFSRTFAARMITELRPHKSPQLRRP
jgi:cytochrome P450